MFCNSFSAGKEKDSAGKEMPGRIDGRDSARKGRWKEIVTDGQNQRVKSSG